MSMSEIRLYGEVGLVGIGSFSRLNTRESARECSSLLISSFPHWWELCFFVARFLRSLKWDQVPC